MEEMVWKGKRNKIRKVKQRQRKIKKERKTPREEEKYR